METLTIAYDERYGVPKYAGLRMTKANFLRWESDDNYAYEFNDGVLEPTTGMKQIEVQLLNRLEDYFTQTDAYQQGARLRGEVDVWVSSEQMRRPDIALFFRDEFRKMATGDNVVPAFVAEFVSEHDDARKYIKKLHEYFQAGVQLVWLVFPDDYIVYVYTSPKTVTICTDADVLSGAPVLPDFRLTVAELFLR